MPSVHHTLIECYTVRHDRVFFSLSYGDDPHFIAVNFGQVGNASCYLGDVLRVKAVLLSKRQGFLNIKDGYKLLVPS